MIDAHHHLWDFGKVSYPRRSCKMVDRITSFKVVKRAGVSQSAVSRFYMPGATHVEFGAVSGDIPKVRRELTLFDETAVWKQICLKSGA